MLSVVHRVAIPAPQTHVVHVETTVAGVAGELPAELVLFMPVWTPGSYLVREYARHVEGLQVEAPASCRKLRKNAWRVRPSGASRVVLRYRVYANELTVRTSHVDDSHAFLVGAALFMGIEGHERLGARVELATPRGWRVATSLPPSPGGGYEAPDYDALVDSPIEIGTHREERFEVVGKPHRYAIWPADAVGDADVKRLVADTRTILAEEAALFGGALPYDTYELLLHLSPRTRGGLEHGASAALIASPAALPHARRLPRPAVAGGARGLPRLEREAHPPRGAHAAPLPGRGVHPPAVVVRGRDQLLRLARPAHLPPLLGRGVPRPPRERDRLPRPDSRTPPAVAGGRQLRCVDQAVPPRREHREHRRQLLPEGGARECACSTSRSAPARTDDRSLDRVLSLLWQEHGATGRPVPEDGMLALFERAAGAPLADLFDAWIRGTHELDLAPTLAHVGLGVERKSRSDGPPASLGVRVKTDAGRAVIVTVTRDAAAWRAGLDPGDELIAVGGRPRRRSRGRRGAQGTRPGRARRRARRARRAAS